MPKTVAADQLHAMKYRGPNEDFEESTNRVAFGLADNGHHYHALRDVMMPQRFCPGGRIQGSIGATRQTTAMNCYVSGTIADSIGDPGGIMDRLKEAAITSQMGGGIGYDFSTLRPRGYRVKKIESEATGPVSFMEYFNTVGLGIASSGHRRGAQMAILRCDHPDIEEFIRAKQTPGRLEGFNISVGVTDEFMAAVAADGLFELKFNGIPDREVRAVDLWQKIMRATWDWAEPGVFFLDTVNQKNNLWYCETIASSNPCFTSDTLVWTAEGQRSFQELVAAKKPVQVLTWKDGRFVYRTMRNIRCTGRKKELVEVVLSRPAGKNKSAITTTIRCTPNHVFHMRDGSKVQAKLLSKGDRITSVYRNPRGNGYVGLNNHACAMMEHHVPFEGVEGLGVLIDAHHIDENKTNNRPSNLELKDHGKHSGEHKLGDNNPMRKHPERNHFRWKDNHGANNGMFGKKHSEQTLEKIGQKTVDRFNDPDFRKRHADSVRASMAKMTPEARARNHLVKSVTWLEEREDVYCGTVDDTHTFFVATGPDEGVLVSNCAEQPLPPGGSCLLGSFNLAAYLKRTGKRLMSEPVAGMANVMQGEFVPAYEFDYAQLKADIPIVVRGMDNVTDRTRYPLQMQADEAKRKRRMGLGVMGLANAGEALGHPYGSEGFLAFEEKVLEIIRDECYRASAALAVEKGPFPLFDTAKYLDGKFIQTLPDDVLASIYKTGIRNSHLTSIAPTGTISMCADNVSGGIEPVFAYVTERPVHTPAGQVMTKIGDYGYEQLGVKGKVTADVTPAEHVAVLLAAQKYVDSAVSKTCNTTGATPWDEFVGIYSKVHAGGGKGCTTFNRDGRRMALLTASTPTAEDGPSCEVDPETGRRDCA